MKVISESIGHRQDQVTASWRLLAAAPEAFDVSPQQQRCVGGWYL